MKTNSRGLLPSKKHVQDRGKDLDYIREMVAFQERRGGRTWDEELRGRYNVILVKHGVISTETLPKHLRPNEHLMARVLAERTEICERLRRAIEFTGKED